MSIGADLPPAAVLGRAQQACVARLAAQNPAARAAGISTDYEEGDWLVVVRCGGGIPPEISRTESGRLPGHVSSVRTRDTYKYPLYIGIGVGILAVAAISMTRQADGSSRSTNGLRLDLIRIAR